MRNSKYFLINPVARQYSGYDSILENEKVDNMLKRISDTALMILQKSTFDLAPKKDRNPDKFRIKLQDIVNSKNSSELLAKVKDYSEDNPINSGKYSETKSLYMEALDFIIDAMKKVEEISKEKSKFFVDIFSKSANEILNTFDDLAREEAKKNESLDYSDESINEGLLTGYKGRTRKLRETLNNLIGASEGKNKRNGYNRDWKRIFIELAQKLTALDTTRSGTGSKDTDILKSLEKDTDRYKKEFNKSLIDYAEREIKNIEDDAELSDVYSDVLDLISKVNDYVTRATTAEEEAEKEIRDEIERREENFNEKVFPLSPGDRDSDSRLEDSDIIKNIQKALIDGIKPVREFLSDKGGADGVYGKATAAVIASLQSQSGNKNSNGEVDRNLLDTILNSSFISEDSRKKIMDSLEKLKENNVSESVKPYPDNPVLLTPLEFFRLLEGEKITINVGELKSQLDHYYENPPSSFKESDPSPKSPSAGGSSIKKEDVESVAKALRRINLKIEADKFLKSDGSLKKKYSGNFLKAWEIAAEAREEDENKIHFFYDGGLYSIIKSSTSINNSLNIPKWVSVNGDDTEDISDFFKYYISSYVSVGGVKRRSDDYSSLVNTFFNKIEDIEDFDLSGVYDKIKPVIMDSLETSYIPVEKLKNKIGSALENLSQKREAERGDDDLGVEDFLGISNILSLIAGTFTYEEGKAISCGDWIKENVLTNDVIKRLNSDSYFSSDTERSPILYLNKKSDIGLEIRRGYVASFRNLFSYTLKSVLGNVPENNKFDVGKLMDSENGIPSNSYMEFHVNSINSREFKDLSEIGKSKCVDVPEEDLKE